MERPSPRAGRVRPGVRDHPGGARHVHHLATVGVPAALVRHVPAVAQHARALETNPLELFPQAFSGRPDPFCVRRASLAPYSFATAPAIEIRCAMPVARGVVR